MCVPISVRVKTYHIYVLPVVLYGLDCLTWTNVLSNHFEVFQNPMMPFITGHKLIDKIMHHYQLFLVKPKVGASNFLEI